MISGLLLSIAASGMAPSRTATLSCGRGTFVAASRRWPRPSPLAPATQGVTVEIAGKRHAVPLEPTRRVSVEGRRVRNRYLLTWGCVTGDAGAHYVVLSYACAIDPGYPNDCGGEKEWFRYLDERGQAVDVGVPRDGPGRTRLQRRLGLAGQFAAGVRMSDVLQ